MNWTKLGEAIGARVTQMDKPAQFRFYASWYGGLPYLGGKENFVYGADCSGTVCGPLYLMGYDIRCTANDLYREIFTDIAPDIESNRGIIAVFYKTLVEREHFGVKVPAGHITHVAPLIGRYVIQNAWEPLITPMSTAYVHSYYAARDYASEWRQLNGDALQRHHVDRDLLCGLDPILGSLR